ncbi:MAG: tetratricopeptide repeat protein [Myxococcota bacterium]
MSEHRSRPVRETVAFMFASLTCLLSIASLASAEQPPLRAEDPFFREALFYAHQGDFFEALGRLDSELAQHYDVDERNLDSLYAELADAEFSVGDFELRYRMHLRAGRAMQAVMNADVAEPIRQDAAYRLARLHFQKGQPRAALEALDTIGEAPPKNIRDAVVYLRANILLVLNRPTEAADALRKIQSSEEFDGFSAYNLGIALLESGEAASGIRQLDRGGKIRAADREEFAIRDKSNLVLGTLLGEAGENERAQKTFERVRLEGPFSNQALLRAGWSEVTAGQFDRAVVPWSILADRDATDEAVQEAQLALPFAYSKLSIHSRAAVLYERAASSFGNELSKIDASLKSIRGGEFLAALEREEIRQDRDWVIRLRSLPEAPETYYLVSLIASHDFQSALQNYLDLAELRRKLIAGKRSLRSFSDITEVRKSYYAPQIPDIDQRFRQLDAQMRVRLEQRRHLDERLTKMLTAPDPELLATAKEQATRRALIQLRDQLDRIADQPGATRQMRRANRMLGLLSWRLETTYHDRLTAVHAHLAELNIEIEKLETQYESFVRTRQAAAHSYVGYGETIRGLEGRVRLELDEIESARARQGKILEEVAVRELERRRERLRAHQNKARFAFADSYDRAAKHRMKP